MKMWAIDEPKRVRRDGLKPYSVGELSYNSYNVQGMVLREVNMDENSTPDVSVDHDRLLSWHWDEFRALCKEAWDGGERGMQHFAIHTSKQKFLAFGQKIVNLALDKEVKLVGFRVIRNTNVSSGYEVFTMQAITVRQEEK
jgi:hypothetical protein